MNYINDTTQVVKSYRELQKDNSNISLAKDGTEILLEVWYLIHHLPKNSYDVYTEKLVAGTILEVNSEYFQPWVVEALTQTQIDNNIKNARDSKTDEIYGYGNNLVKGAYTNPIQGVTKDPNRYEITVAKRKSNKSDKMAGDISITQADKDVAKSDEKLSGYSVKIDADENKAIDNMLKLNTVQEIKAFDVASETWNVWTPPV